MILHKLVILLPLLSFIIVAGLRNILPRIAANIIACGLLLTTASIAAYLFWDVAFLGHKVVVPLFDWIKVADFHASWALNFDTLSTVMIVVITSVSSLVHVYSTQYMSHDVAPQRFMSYLSLFTFMMLMLVSATNFIQLFFGWEGVGLASYLLIGFWYHKDSANNAAIKAFVVNRVGDLALVAGIGLCFYMFNSVDFSTILSGLNAWQGKSVMFFGYSVPALELLAMLVFIGAMGKSAQLGLHTWLPDAMEGPTPVSALIHAATMVTAGVVLVCKMSPLFELAPFAKSFVLIIGASTALFAGTIALTQNDIKRVIAYSTCSQLGYMFAACGVGAYAGAMFHLFTHAFFKALLFLGAGAVIHAMSDEQDMRNMGGLRTRIKLTYALMLLGSLALMGIPPLAGHYSKDVILESIWLDGSSLKNIAFYCGIIAAFLTAFYSCRLLFMTFHGESRADEKVLSRVHEPGLMMMIPLLVLSVGAIAAGYLFAPYFIGNTGDFWGQAIVTTHLPHIHHPPSWVVHLPLVVGVCATILAILAYLIAPKLPEITAKVLAPVYKLFHNKWYFDQIYNCIFVLPSRGIGYILWQTGDLGIIDKFGPHGITSLISKMSSGLSSLNTGYIFHYAIYIALGMLGIITLCVYQSL